MLGYQLLDALVGQVVGVEGFDGDRNWLRDADGVGNDDFNAVGESGGNQIFAT